MALTLEVGQTATLTLNPLESDGTTITPGAVLSNVNWSITQDGQIINNTNPPNEADLAIAADSVGTATVNVTATVTEENGATGTVTGSEVITVILIPPPLTTSLGITNSAPAGV